MLKALDTKVNDLRCEPQSCPNKFTGMLLEAFIRQITLMASGVCRVGQVDGAWLDDLVSGDGPHMRWSKGEHERVGVGLNGSGVCGRARSACRCRPSVRSVCCAPLAASVPAGPVRAGVELGARTNLGWHRASLGGFLVPYI